MKPIREKRRKKFLDSYFFICLLLAFNTFATERLNKKYNSVVAWDSERKLYCGKMSI